MPMLMSGVLPPVHPRSGSCQASILTSRYTESIPYSSRVQPRKGKGAGVPPLEEPPSLPTSELLLLCAQGHRGQRITMPLARATVTTQKWGVRRRFFGGGTPTPLLLRVGFAGEGEARRAAPLPCYVRRRAGGASSPLPA